MEDYRVVNKANWDERVPAHVESRDYAVERFVADLRRLAPQEVRQKALRLDADSHHVAGELTRIADPVSVGLGFFGSGFGGW